MQKSKSKIKAGIFIVSIIFQSMNSVALVLSGVSKEFGHASTTTVQLVFTLMSLMSVVGMLSTGKLASIFTKKKLIILSNILLILGGLIGYFASFNIPMLYLAGVMIGISSGVIIPTASALISIYFKGLERASMNGLQSVFVCGGGMFFNILGGFLASYNWRSLYLIFLFGIPVIIFTMLLIPEGEVDKKEDGSGFKLFNSFIVLLSLQSLIFGIACFTLFTNVTYYVYELGIGNESHASLITIAFSAGAVIMGIIIPIVMRWSGRFCFATGLSLSAIGLWVMFFVNNLPILILGGLLIGLGFGLFMPSGYTLIPENVRPAAITMSISLFTACYSFGGFLNPYIVTLIAGVFNSHVSTRFLIGAIIMSLDVVLCIVITLKKKVTLPGMV